MRPQTRAFGVVAAMLVIEWSLPQAADRIAFASKRDGNWEVYVSDPAGRNQRRLTRRSELDRYPMWSPDRSRIAFMSQATERTELWVMTATGESQRRLAEDVIAKASRDWFPDGRRIAVTAIVNRDTVVAIVDAVGSTPMLRLTRGRSEDRDPSLSPDGRMIAFSSTRDGNRELYVMNADGTGQRRLTHSDGLDGSPAWSPDGSTIAFVSEHDGTKDLFRIRPDGQGLERLTTGAQATRDQPRWSPDGTRIAVQMARGTNYDIGVVLVARHERIDVATSPDYDGSFTWSPDSKALAYVSGPTNQETLRIVSADGRESRRVTETPALTPGWASR